MQELTEQTTEQTLPEITEAFIAEVKAARAVWRTRSSAVNIAAKHNTEKTIASKLKSRVRAALRREGTTATEYVVCEAVAAVGAYASIYAQLLDAQGLGESTIDHFNALAGEVTELDSVTKGIGDILRHARTCIAKLAG